jgi:hypothetical protein
VPTVRTDPPERPLHPVEKVTVRLEQATLPGDQPGTVNDAHQLPNHVKLAEQSATVSDSEAAPPYDTTSM